MENKLLSIDGRLELLKDVTKEGLLTLTTADIRGKVTTFLNKHQ